MAVEPVSQDPGAGVEATVPPSGRPPVLTVGLSISRALAAVIPGYVEDDIIVIDDWVVEIRGHDPHGPLGGVFNLIYPGVSQG